MLEDEQGCSFRSTIGGRVIYEHQCYQYDVLFCNPLKVDYCFGKRVQVKNRNNHGLVEGKDEVVHKVSSRRRNRNSLSEFFL